MAVGCWFWEGSPTGEDGGGHGDDGLRLWLWPWPGFRLWLGRSILGNGISVRWRGVRRVGRGLGDGVRGVGQDSGHSRQRGRTHRTS